MKEPVRILPLLPLCGVVLIGLYLFPFFMVQTLPASMIQKGSIIKLRDSHGRRVEIAGMTGTGSGPYRHSPFLLRASQFSKRWYFSPVARALRLVGWGSNYKYL